VSAFSVFSKYRDISVCRSGERLVIDAPIPHFMAGHAEQYLTMIGGPPYHSHNARRSYERLAIWNNTSMRPLPWTPKQIDNEDTTMDKDRIKGSAEQAKGAVKETVGKVFGDKKLETEGKTDKVAGKVQNAVGGLKDAMRGK
jgi:uncharacterized protein YjbJ (UPF0337 family)